MLTDNQKEPAANELRAQHRSNTRRDAMVRFCCLAFCAVAIPMATANTTNTSDRSQWLTQPLSLSDAIRTALSQNSDVLRSQHDLEAAHGIALQTRAIVFPKLRGAAD